MKSTRIKTLENLNLTKEEAQEWIEMLSEKEHSDWEKVVQKHTFIPDKIKTNRVVCYRNDDGSFEYHYYVDGKKADRIYAVQIGPAPTMSLPNIPYYLMKIKDDAKSVSIIEAFSLETDEWKLIQLEEICCMYNMLDEDDTCLLKTLYDCGVNFESLDVFNTWYKDNYPSTQFRFNVRLFRNLSNVIVSD